MPRSWPRSAADGRVVRRPGAGPRRRATSSSTRASPSSAPVIEAAAGRAPGRGGRRPEDRARPRLLHGLRLRDRAGRARQLGSICSGGRYDTLASDGATTYPGVGLSIGVSRLVSRLIGARTRPPRPAPCRAPCWSRWPTRRHAAASDAVAAALRAGASRRGRAVRGEVRQADPARRPPRHPVRLVPGRGRDGVRPGQGHPVRRAGRRRPSHLDPAGRGPAVRRSRPAMSRSRRGHADRLAGRRTDEATARPGQPGGEHRQHRHHARRPAG